MKFDSLKINNFGAIVEANLRLDDCGLVLIQGDNQDDSSAISNGAGKSTIPDALCWCLYGTTARGDEGDKIVNRTVGKDCVVSVGISDGTASYRISRHRKHTTFKNRTVVVKIDGGVEQELTKGTEKETQALINSIIGCDLSVFAASIYAGQEKMADLPAMTDKQLKELIEEAAGITRLQKAYAEALRLRTQAETELTRASSALAGLEAQILFLDESEKATLERQRAHRAEHEKQIEAERNALAALIAARRNYGDLDAAEKVYQNAIAAIDYKLAGVASEHSTLAKLNASVTSSERALVLKMQQLEAAKANLLKIKSAADDVATLIGKPCAECGKPHTEADSEQLREHLTKQAAEASRVASELGAECKELRAKHDAAVQAVNDFKATMTDTTASVAERAAADAMLKHIRDQKIERHEHEVAIASATAAVKRIEGAIDPFVTVLDDLRAKLEKTMELVKVGKALTQKRERELLVAKSAVEVFGPAGVRAQILDTVTPFLNARTAEYLNHVSDGNLSAIWTTLSRTAKGDVREKFRIEVTSVTGGDSFSSLSGGEKRKVRLACALALQDLVASRASKPIDIFIGDEIDHALDPAGLERLMSLLERKARERGTVLVISHGDLTDWIREVLIVTKKGGGSVVSGALVI